MISEKIKKDNYIFVPSLITPKRSAYLSSLYSHYLNNTKKILDEQVPNSPSSYNFVPFVRLLVELVPKVSDIFGEDLLPTYVYARNYKNGAVLKRHRDRPACEVSLTLNLSKDVGWPIFIQKQNGEEVSLDLSPGDAMMYSGCVADHWRDEFKGNDYTQVFLHYVRAYGENCWAFFDKFKDPKEYNGYDEYKDEIPYTLI